jgi:S1-C subfamily serine protease
MPVDDDDADDASAFGPLLPPEDRLWRHPSEIGARGPAGDPPLATAGETRVANPTRSWGLAVLAGMMGAVLAVGCIVLVTDFESGPTPIGVPPTASLVPITAEQASGPDAVMKVASKVAPAVARLEVDGDVSGSAIVIRGDGYLVTNAHLIEGKHTVRVVLSDGRTFKAKLVGSDDETDVAVVKVTSTDLDAAALGSALDLQAGQSCMSISSPGTEAKQPVVVVGVVRAVGRDVDRSGREALQDMIETDAPLLAGGSGGALVDADGHVIGLATAVDNDDGTGSAGYATPIDVAKSVANDIIQIGHVRHTWLGLQGSDLGVDAAKRMNVAGGAVVRNVTDGSPAKTAGLAAGDVIVAFDGAAITSMSALLLTLRSHQAGDRLRVSYVRDDSRRSTVVTLTERPAK